MNYLRPDKTSALRRDLAELKALPRPVYGHAEGLPNKPLSYRHSHPWVQLSYAARGVVHVHTSNGLFVAPPQRAIWIPAGIQHQVYCSADTQINSLYIASEAASRHNATCKVLGVTPLLRELIRSFGSLPVEYDESGPDGRLVRVLLDQLSCAPVTGLMLPWPNDPRLRKLCDALQARPDSQESLNRWAARLDVSERTLSRLFTQQTGLTFRLWRQRLRLLSALPLLERGERVTDAALACGYDSLSAFIAAFGEQFGTTPGEFFSRSSPGPGPTS